MTTDSAHHDGHGEPTGFIRRYVFSTDHKMIAMQYLFTGVLFLFLAGAFALLIRWQLAYPGQPVPLIGFLFEGGTISNDTYNVLFTMHGTMMVFFAITPIVIGAFGNYLIPLSIGAEDMAFPKLNMLSYWMVVPGSLILLVSLFLGDGGAAGGWTAYPPLSASTSVELGLSQKHGQTLWILAIVFIGTSSLMGGINYIATVLNMRCPGMTLMRMPLTIWGLFYTSILNVLWVPVVAAALIFLLLDRVAGTTFFMAGPLAPQQGGQPLLYQHLFWGFGHPEVYILILPVWGIVADILATFSRKPAFGYKATVYSMGIIVTLSQVVWGHHMFTSGMNPLVGKAFMFLTLTISIPSAIFFLNWLGTIWQGSLRLTTPMLFALGIVFVFGIGGLTGLLNAVQTIDVYIHDTYFVVGHFHFTLAASVLFGAFAGIYFWYPKMFGKHMSEFWGKVHFWGSFIFLCAVFGAMFRLGIGGHMRRIANPNNYDFLKEIQHWNVYAGWATLGLVVTQLPFAINFFGSLFRKTPASENPWEACTLEWTAPSPPGHGNFASTPVVYGGPHEYSVPGMEQDFRLQTMPLNGEAEGPPPVAETVGVETPKLALWLFLSSEVMMFTGLIGSYIVLRLGNSSWPDPGKILDVPVLAFNTFVLICSSVTMVYGLKSAREGKRDAMVRYLLATMALGLVFLGIKAFDYVHLYNAGTTISSGLFGSVYYTLTGLHGLHVFAGCVTLLVVAVLGQLERVPPKRAGLVENVGLYWHFVDLVWVILFAILCLM